VKLKASYRDITVESIHGVRSVVPAITGIVDFRAMNNVYRPSEVLAVYVVEIRHIADRRGTQRMSAIGT